MTSPKFELGNPIVVALDVDCAEEAFRIAELLRGRAGAFKVGPRLGVRYGRDLVSRLAGIAPVFVDNKYLDIPTTMEAAVRATFDAGAGLATVHAWAGPEALGRLAGVEAELNRVRPFKLLVVTVLTSFSQSTLVPSLRRQPIADQVRELTRMSLQCGLSGIVCSPQEVAAVRAEAPQGFLVTPGVRLVTDENGDQKRVETPEAAIRAGASALVVGRPVVEAVDPVAAFDRILYSAQRGQSRVKTEGV